MTETDPSLDLEIAGLSIAARLDQAIERGDVRRQDDGTLSLAAAVTDHGSYITKFGQVQPPCEFLNYFLFEKIYGESAVPFGCRRCYKIKISSKSLRQMMAAKAIAESSGHTTKSGAEVNNTLNQDLYGTYLYFQGLDQARKAFQDIRQRLDQHPDLGPGIEMKIKRGCTNYELKCGPSDQYKFDPRLELAEAYLFRRFTRNEPTAKPEREQTGKQHARWLLKMIATAYRIGDDTYKDFTGGKPLFPSLVSYPPNDE